MPTRCPGFLIAALLAAALAGCGDGDPAASATATAPAGAGSKPALAREPLQAGEVLYSGEASPVSHGPFSLDGRYRVRFAQFAPEDPNIDFAGQTPFTASLRPDGSTADGDELFSADSAGGTRTITRKGRYVLEVTFGDFPYAVRFTPLR